MDKILIIAEAGVNHNGDIDRAFELVDVAARAGADIVKFQSFRADKLASRDAPKADYQIANTGAEESQYDMLKRLELSEDDHAALINRCREKGIAFLSTPFDVEGLHMLVERFGLATIKLGSSELTNGPILLAAAHTKRQVILSTGMGSMDEIREALGVLAFGYLYPDKKPARADFVKTLEKPEAQKVLQQQVTLLHCTTAYPAPPEDANLKAMQTMADEFGVPVGYSDHTLGIEVSVAAAAMGARVIEKHFTLDRNLPGPDHKASLEPDQLALMIAEVRAMQKEQKIGHSGKSDRYMALARVAIGSGEKTPAPSERVNMSMARKSLVAARAIGKGEKFSENNLAIKRPATGLSPMEYWDILGKTAPKDFQPDQAIDL